MGGCLVGHGLSTLRAKSHFYTFHHMACIVHQISLNDANVQGNRVDKGDDVRQPQNRLKASCQIRAFFAFHQFITSWSFTRLTPAGKRQAWEMRKQAPLRLLCLCVCVCVLVGSSVPTRTGRGRGVGPSIDRRRALVSTCLL